MNILQIIFTNGFIPFIPILLWNILLAQKLPHPYSSEQFDQGIPAATLSLEIVTRILVFMMPLFLRIDINRPAGRAGLLLFIGGTLIYFTSWLLLILIPRSAWSRSLMGFSAPAWTPLIWLTGIAFMLDSWYFSLEYQPWQYLLPAGLFVLFHFSHTKLAFRNTQ